MSFKEPHETFGGVSVCSSYRKSQILYNWTIFFSFLLPSFLSFFLDLFIYLFIHSFIHLFIYLFIYLVNILRCTSKSDLNWNLYFLQHKFVDKDLQKALRLFHQVSKNKDCIFMTENETFKVVLRYYSKVSVTILLKSISSVYKCFNFNMALNKEISWSSFSVFSRTWFLNKGLLIRILYFDLWLRYLVNAKWFFEEFAGYLWEG